MHGPGCPVCVTPLEMLDKAHAIARRPEVIFCSFGDMLRVPGSNGDLFTIKAGGGDVRVVYSPLDCLKIARANPDKKVVFFAIGFETTAPANAMLVWRAQKEGLKNVSILVSHVLVPPSIAAILESPQNRVQGFLGPGHVCAIMGYREYEPMSARFKVPIVITGFEPLDILQGTLMTIRQLETGRAEVENQYSRILDREGNRPAQKLVSSVFEIADRKWRGVGSSRRVDTNCGGSSASMMRKNFLKKNRSTRTNRIFVSADGFSEASRNRMTARPLALSVLRSDRWERPWCRRKVRVPPTMRTAGI